MLRTIIIDDEQDAVNIINTIIKKYCNNIEVVGKAFSVVGGTELAKKLKPDLIILDVEMQDGTGFNLLENFPTPDFHVIFVTAYNHYAIKAIKFSAADYILKPLNIQEFISAIQKVINKKDSVNNSEKLITLLENINSSSPVKLAIPTSDGTEYLNIADIIRIQADGSYSKFSLNNNKTILVSKNIGEYQELLIDKDFLRVHNSHLVNLLNVKKHVKSDGGYILMTDNYSVPLSKSKRELFVSLMKNISK
jgi:two-component system LytT family response regulator